LANSIIHIITDASEKIGMGHVMRELTIARMAKKNGKKVHFHSFSEIVNNVCEKENFNCSLYSNNFEIVSSLLSIRPETLIIDTHQSDFNAYRDLESVSPKIILVVSEVGHYFKPYGKYFIRMGSRMDKWSIEHTYNHNHKTTTILAGRKWIIFRKEFFNINVLNKSENTISIIHGGTDPYNLTSQSVEMLSHTNNIYNINVFVTNSFPHLEYVKSILSKSKHIVTIYQDTKDIARYLSKSTIVIINGGNVRYEACITQTPFVAISFQPTQYSCTKEITDQGVGINAGLFSEIEPVRFAAEVDNLMSNVELRASMKRKMKILFDLKGIERINKLYK